MSKLVISIVIGIAAGVIDVIPMIAQKLPIHASVSAFVHWVVLGVLISYVKMPFPAWLTGVIVALLAALPVVILVLKTEPKSIIPILSMSAVLGALVGIATAKYAH